MSVLRSIVHMDLDTFFVSCERLLDSRLVGKPILIGGTSDRGVVASCSYEARQFGIHSAMPMKMARERCPEAIVIKGNTQTYSGYSRAVTEIIREAVPVYEKMSIDEFYIDFTGMDRFFGTFKYAGELRQRILKETGLPISFGLSQNKTVSKIATGEATIIPRRQALPKAFHRDGSIYITKTEVIKNGSLYGNKIAYMESNPEFHVNIDTMEDWEKAEKNRG
mgnify:CR=1 FL=1